MLFSAWSWFGLPLKRDEKVDDSSVVDERVDADEEMDAAYDEFEEADTWYDLLKVLEWETVN